MPHPSGVTFVGRAGSELTLYALATCCGRETSMALADAPRLGDRVSVGTQSVVLGPVEVGDDTRIGFNVVVNRDAPSGVLVVSRAMRAKIVKRPSEQQSSVADAAGHQQ